MNNFQLREYLVKPTLAQIDLHSEAAENLVVGTIIHESANFEYIDQTISGDGPAYGCAQMEALTHNDMWRWLNLPTQATLRQKVMTLIAPWPSNPLHQLRTNNAYAVAMCRIKYRTINEPLPDAKDLDGIANYWKRYYNTLKGKGRIEDFISSYRKAK